MSYILDALRKAEHDRRTQHTSNLDVPLPAPAKPAKSAQWFIIIALLLIVILGLLLYIFLPNQKEDKIISRTPKVEKVEPDETDSPNTFQIPPRPAQRTEPTQPIESSIADLMEKQTLTHPTKKPRAFKNNEIKQSNAERTPITRDGMTPPKAKQPLETQKNKKLEQWNKVMGPLIKDQKPKPANDQKQIRSAKKANKEIPWLNDLSPDFKRNLPVLNVNVYVYDEDPKARFVVVNMRKFRPGQTITDDILLEDITPHSMILKFGDEMFRIPRP